MLQSAYAVSFTPVCVCVCVCVGVGVGVFAQADSLLL